MLLTIAIIAVVVLLAVALLPMKKREPEQLRQASPVAFLTPEPAQPVRQTTLRQQQLDEEATAVAPSINAAPMRLVERGSNEGFESA